MKTYPLFKVHVPKNALSNIHEVLESGFINEGAQVTQLTNALKHEMQSERLILTNSCTSALTLALYLAGVKPGDEVITTPMTCVATNTPIITMGAKIVWADINPNNGMIDPRSIAKKITSRTKAVMAVAWSGTPPELQTLRDLCEVRGIKLILDAAHAFDANYKLKPIHEWADYTCYSFQAIKHFTTGDGGALICANDDDYKRSKSLKWFGLDRDHAKDDKGNWKGQQWDVDIIEAGYKFNMNNIAAAIGLAQLDSIADIIGLHRKHAQMYDHMFAGNPDIVPLERPKDSNPSFWVYTMKVTQRCHISRDELLKALNDQGIMAGVVHVPNDEYTAFSELKTDLPGVREFSANQFSLPCGWWLNSDDVNHIAARVMDLTR